MNYRVLCFAVFCLSSVLSSGALAENHALPDDLAYTCTMPSGQKYEFTINAISIKPDGTIETISSLQVDETGAMRSEHIVAWPKGTTCFISSKASKDAEIKYDR